MSYANAADVKALFRELNTTGTDAAISDAKITDWLDSSYNAINARLKNLYTLPITTDDNPESVKILKQIEAFKVAAIVDDILNNYSNEQKKPSWDKKAEVMLDSIAPKKDKSTGKQPEPDSILPDANYLGTNVQQGTFKASSTAGTKFQKGTDGW